MNGKHFATAWSYRCSPFTDFSSQLLSPPNRDYDFERVAIGELQRIKLAAGYDFTVAFECYALAGKIELVKQTGDVQRCCKGPSLTIDYDFNHFRMWKSAGKVNPSTWDTTLPPLPLQSTCRRIRHARV